MPRNTSVNDDDLDDDDDEPEDPSELVKFLRKQLKAKGKDAQESAQLKRENAMLKAGVDTQSKLGALFAKSFDGDLSDIEAIKAEATEIGLLQAPTSTETGAEGTGEGTGEVSDSGTGERANLASGAMPDDGKGVDPRQSAMERATEEIKKGATFDRAAGSLISDLVQAAVAGDARVIVKGNAF